MTKPLKIIAKEAGIWDYAKSSPPVILGGGALGAAAGRYIAAPLLADTLGFDRDRANLAFTILGGLLGASPGILHGLTQSKLKGSFFAPTGEPRNPEEKKLMDAAKQWRPSVAAPRELPNEWSGNYLNNVIKSSADNIWKPNFPVSMAIDEVVTNANIPFTNKVKMVELITQAGQEQGVGLTGLASPAALFKALPKVITNAIPTVGGAYVVSELLGAPKWLRNTAMGSALISSALTNFMGENRDNW